MAPGPPGRCTQLLLRLAERINWPTLPSEAVLALTQFLYGEVLVLNLPAKLDISIWTIVHLAIAGLLAQLTGTVAIRIMESCLSVNIHTPTCRNWGATQVFCASALQASVQYQIGLVAAVIIPSFLAFNVQFMYFDWMLWAPIAKRPAGLPQPNSKRPRQQQVDVEISSLQTIDAITCNEVAMHLTIAANKDISSHFVDGCGLKFDVSLRYLGESADNH